MTRQRQIWLLWPKTAPPELGKVSAGRTATGLCEIRAKPDGGVRKLGIPTVLNRFIQQAAMQVLQRKWDPTFSEHSYGCRPGRSAHQAVEQAQKYLAEGYRWVVDLDLEKFFDRVNHDKLRGQIAPRVTDKRFLRLIRAFLTAGVMEDGLVSPVDEGTPQGGPLSPLLSNLVLDQWDHARSRRAGDRVMASVMRYLAFWALVSLGAGNPNSGLRRRRWSDSRNESGS